MSQERKDTSAKKHEQIQQGVRQRRVLHKSPTRGATIPPTYLSRMYHCIRTGSILEEELIPFTIGKGREAIH